MASILLKVSGQEQSEHRQIQNGAYNPQVQLWDTIACANTVEEGLGIVASTAQTNTYSFTTRGGDDRDIDDRGT
jgi:hypothetical protein